MGFEEWGGMKDFFHEEGNCQEKQQDPFLPGATVMSY